MSKRRPAETPEAKLVREIFDAMIARRRAEARQAHSQALEELAAMRQAVAQKLQRRRRPAGRG